MSTPRTIPSDAQHGAISYDLIVDGSPIDSSYQLISFTTIKEANRIPTARIVIRDGDAGEENFPISETNDFIPGNTFEIKAGYDQNNTLIFKGIIVKHAIKIRESGEANLYLELKDAAVKMTIGRHSRYFDPDQTDNQVIDTLIGLYGDLQKEVEATNHPHPDLVQFHTSDWDFMLSRAEVNGQLVLVDDGKITVKKPDTSGEAALELLYGATIVELEAEIDARTQWKKAKAKSWDYANQALFEAESSSTSFADYGNLAGSTLADTINLEAYQLSHSGQIPQEELQAWTDATMMRSRLAKIRGRVKILVGYAEIKPGDLLNLAGLGARFNGKAFVTGVRHELGEGRWDTHIQFGLSPKPFASQEEIIDFPAAGLVPAIQGLQIGKVVKLEGDPDGEDRIQVKLPVLDNAAEGIWARLATLDAGNQRGSVFRPEIDDEVVVGFLNQDPRDAVVLGHLHSSQNPAPIPGSDDNHEKGFTTRSGMRIHFNDDTKITTIDTPAGNKVVLDEENTSITVEDQNGNVMLMDPNGIKVESPQKVEVIAGTEMSLKAATDMKLEATNITIKASAAANVEGATVAAKASGIAEVKGSLVKIN